MRKRHMELLYALIAIIVVTGIYAAAYAQAGAFPAASGLVGHGIGILGFILMLMTETLYSIRKQMTDSRWGSMAGWLSFHMVTGLVGPYMVLLHTSMRFNGLAGVVTLLTVVVMISGVIGRYVYTAVPRPAEVSGDAPSAALEPAAEPRPDPLAARRRALATWYAFHIPLTWALFTTAAVHVVAALDYATLQR